MLSLLNLWHKAFGAVRGLLSALYQGRPEGKFQRGRPPLARWSALWVRQLNVLKFFISILFGVTPCIVSLMQDSPSLQPRSRAF